MPGIRDPWRNVPAQTPCTTTPPGDPLTEYLQRLIDRRDAALVAENAALVADCEERIIRYESFLTRLTFWGDTGGRSHAGASRWPG